MSETQSTETAPKAKLSDTIVDLGLTWADMGIGLGMTAIAGTARALDATAKCLESLQGRLKGVKSAPLADEKPAAERAPKPENEVRPTA